jgi:hypothetical protein
MIIPCDRVKEFLLKECIIYALSSTHSGIDVNLRETPAFMQNAAPP